MSKRLFICLSSFSTWLRSFRWISLPYIDTEINTKSKASEWNKEADQYKTNSVDDTSRLFWLPYLKSSHIFLTYAFIKTDASAWRDIMKFVCLW